MVTGNPLYCGTPVDCVLGGTTWFAQTPCRICASPGGTYWVGSIAFTITLPTSLVTRTLVFFQMPSFFMSSGFISQIEHAVKYSGVVFPFSIACPSSIARWVIIFRIIFVMPYPRQILGCE